MPNTQGNQWDSAGVSNVTGTLAATGDTSATPFQPAAGRPFNLELTGTWAGTAVLKRKLAGESTFKALTVGGSAWGSYTGNVSEQAWEESEAGAQFMIDWTRTSGSLVYRISQ